MTKRKDDLEAARDYGRKALGSTNPHMWKKAVSLLMAATAEAA